MALLEVLQFPDPRLKRVSKRIEEVTDELERCAVERALCGTREEVYQGGQLVGYRTKYSSTLLIFLLRNRRPAQYNTPYGVVNFPGDTNDDVVFESRITSLGRPETIKVPMAEWYQKQQHSKNGDGATKADGENFRSSGATGEELHEKGL